MKKVLVIIGALFLSCNGEENTENVQNDKLDKDLALEILREEYKGDFCKGNITIGLNGAWGREGELADYNEDCAVLQDQGLVVLTTEWNSKRGYNESSLVFTETARNEYEANEGGYGRGSVMLTTEHAQEILGMSFNEEEDEAQVLFSTISQETPFYILAHDKSVKKCRVGVENEREVTFVKYDTGWKLRKEN